MDFETLSREIHELRDMRDRLAGMLTEAIARLREWGTCPPRDVLDAASRYRSQYLETRQRLSDEGGIELADLSNSLEEWERAVRLAQRQQQVAGLLDEAVGWQIRGGDGPGPLTKVQEDIESLKQRLRVEDDAEVRDLLEGRHRLTAVRTLVHSGDDLTDETWADLLDRVARDYGRDLATAISRGKILVRSEGFSNDAETVGMQDLKAEVLT